MVPSILRESTIAFSAGALRPRPRRGADAPARAATEELEASNDQTTVEEDAR